MMKVTMNHTSNQPFLPYLTAKPRTDDDEQMLTFKWDFSAL